MKTQHAPATTLMMALFALLLWSCASDPANNNPDGSADGDADSDSDSDVDGDSDSDADTDTYENPCEGEGEHAGCYGNEVWCLDGDDTPVTQMEVCTGGAQCVELSPVYAECQCVPETYTACYNGDVWWYDSCDEFGEIAADCEDPQECVAIDGSNADCCVADDYQQCGEDGNVHYFSTCELGDDQEGDMVGDACVANADCVNLTSTTAECQCRNQWTGDNCEICPPHWDPDADCGACDGYWSGSDCNTCDGYGSDVDRCQCPSDYFLPQPGTENCWTCPLPLNAVAGVCVDAGMDLTWPESDAACAGDWRLPMALEVASINSTCVDDGSEINCDNCAASSPCNEMLSPYIPANVWLSDECAEGHLTFAIASGSMDWTGSCVADSTVVSLLKTMCIR